MKRNIIDAVLTVIVGGCIAVVLCYAIMGLIYILLR
jgi:hypothetical protein